MTGDGQGPVDATELARMIRDREVSPGEVIWASLRRIGSRDREINACVVILEDSARETARRAERAIYSGEELGPLHGVPVAVTESIPVHGIPRTLGIRRRRDAVDHDDAVAVERLRAAGAIVVAKTNIPGRGCGAYTDNSMFGLTRNPWDMSRTPGGSSGGAAAAVAAEMTPIALGDDGVGSVRIPASFCGIAGLKPTFGLIPRGRGFPGVDTLSALGPLTRSVRDLALCLEVLAGPHSTDDLSLPNLSIDYVSALQDLEIPRLRVAQTADFGFASVDGSVRAAFESAIDQLTALGWNIEEAHPTTPDPLELRRGIFAGEYESAIRELLEGYDDEVDHATARTVGHSQGTSMNEYIGALRERRRYAEMWSVFFADYDLLLTPSTTVTAFPAGTTGPSQVQDHRTDPLTDVWYASHSYPANLTRQPAVSLPCGFDENGLPIGLQIIGRRAEDDLVLRAAAVWEETARVSCVTPWSPVKQC